MANSYIEVSTSGTTYVLPDTFIYLDIDDINALGKNGDGSYSALTISSRTSSTRTIVLSGTPSQSTIRFYRATTSQALVNFVDGARLTEADLDKAYRQGLFAAQEVLENASAGVTTISVSNIAYSQLDAGFTLPTSQLSGTITNAQLAGSIANSKLDNIANSKLAAGVGTSANNLVALDGSAKLPAVDGSQLTNLPAPTFTSGLVFLLDADMSGVANYDITSTYINSTYDEYYITFDLLPANDGVDLHGTAIVGGSVTTASKYAFEHDRIGTNAEDIDDATDVVFFNPTFNTIGNAAGEGITGHVTLQNVNSTTRSCVASGIVNYFTTGGAHNADTFAGAFLPANRADVVNGLRFAFSGGNIASGNVKVYGLKKT